MSAFKLSSEYELKIRESERKLSMGWTEPTRSSIESAIATIYLRRRMPAPPVIWCQSPLQLSMMPFLLQHIVLIRHEEREALFNELSHEYHRNTCYQLNNQLTDPIETKILNGYARGHVAMSSVHETVGGGIQNLSKDASRHIAKKYDAKLINYLDSVIFDAPRRTLERVQRVLGTSLNRYTFHNSYQPFTSGSRMQNIIDRFRPSVVPPELNRQPMQFRQPLIERFAWYEDGMLDFATKANVCEQGRTCYITWGVVSSDPLLELEAYLQVFGDNVYEGCKNQELLNAVLTVRAGALAYIFTDVCVFACRLPKRATFDTVQRLHNEGSVPAVEFDDGHSIDSWHGVLVPDDIARNPKLITMERIDTEINAELRAVMLETFGWENYIREAKLEMECKDGYGTLYRLWQRGMPICIVKVRNSTPEIDGSFKDYYLPVPPNVSTPKQAIAWTFGMNEREYAPEVET